MKNFLKILSFLIAASVGFGAVAVGDVKVSQATSASPVAWKDMIFTPAANSILNFNSSVAPTATGDVTLAGSMLLGAATGGMPGTGIINAKGFKIDGVDVGLSTDSYWEVDGTVGIKYDTGTVEAALKSTTTLGVAGPNLSSSLAARAGAQGLVTTGVTPIIAPTVGNFGNKGFAIGAWITATTLSNILFSPSAGNDMYFRINANGTLSVVSGDGSQNILSTGAIAVNERSLVLYTTDGTTATFYINGKAAGGGFDSYNWGTVAGIASGGYAGFVDPIFYNRHLTASDALLLFQDGGPAAADLPATPAGTERIVDGNFSVATNWILGSAWSIGSGVATCNGGADGGTSTEMRQTGGNWKAGERVRTTYKLANVTSGNFAIGFGSGAGSGKGATRNASGTYTEEIVLTADATFITTGLTSASLNNGATLDNLSVISCGCLAAYSPTQPGRGATWYDVSGHGANITWGAGVSWAHPDSSTISLGTTPSLQATIAGDAVGGLTISTTTGKAVALNSTYGGIVLHDGVTAQTGISNTYVKFTGWTNNGLFNNTTPAFASGKITTITAGNYYVAWTLGTSCNTSTATIEVAVFVDGVEQDSSQSTINFIDGTNIFSVSGVGFVTAAAGKEIDLRVKRSTAGAISLTPKFINLTVQRVSN